MIRTTNLTFNYAAGPSFRFPDVEVSMGEVGLLKGPSGSGKTTFLQILAGQRKPSSGELDVPTTMGFILQRPRLIPSLRVFENMTMVPKADPSHVRELAAQLGLDSVMGRMPSTLSEGERQRVAIVRTFANHPKVVLADEPTSALDDEHTDSWMRLMHQLCKKEGVALLVATHDPRLITSIPGQLTYSMR
jgi:putative ABC transport system ATP-binding protein